MAAVLFAASLKTELKRAACFSALEGSTQFVVKTLDIICNFPRIAAVYRLHRYVPQRCTFACRTGTPARRQSPGHPPAGAFLRSTSVSSSQARLRWLYGVLGCRTEAPTNGVDREPLATNSIKVTEDLHQRVDLEDLVL
jgi:hypothetical protein